MKKWIVYILSLTALVVSLCACGTAEKPAATNAPRPSGSPMTATPDMNDGIVNDDDGIITDDDTGVVPTQTRWRTRRPNRPPLRRRRMAQQKSEKHPAGPKWTGGAFCKARKPVSRVLSAQPSI